MTKDDLDGGAGLFYGASDPTDMMLPPLPNFLFQRDPSSWIYGGVTINPMTKPARRPETAIMEAIYRFHPMFTAGGGVKVWFGGVEQDWGRCTIEGGDVADDRQRRGDDRHGRAHHARSRSGSSPAPCSPRAPRGSCSRSSCRRRAPTCTSTRS